MDNNDSSIISKISSIIGEDEEFSFNLLSNEDCYKRIVSNVKNKLLKKIEPNQSMDNSFFEFNNNSLILYNLNYFFVNKILRLVTRNTTGFYFNQGISKLKIHLSNSIDDGLLIFGFLFLYVLKHLPIKNVYIGKLVKQNEETMSFIIYYLQCNPAIETITIKSQLNCLGGLIIYDVIKGKGDKLTKIKLYNIDVKLLELTKTIQALPMLQKVILVDVRFSVINEKSFNDFIIAIQKSALTTFEFKRSNKFFSLSTILTSYEFGKMISLLNSMNHLNRITIQDMKNICSNDIITSYYYDSVPKGHTSINHDKIMLKNSYLNLLCSFINFSNFSIFKLNNFMTLDIGLLDENSYQALLKSIESVFTIKSLTCRFQDDFNASKSHFMFLHNKKLHMRIVHLYNVNYTDSIEELCESIYANKTIEELIISSLHTRTIYPNNITHKFPDNLIPYYHINNTSIIYGIFFCIKHISIKLYNSKKYMFDIARFLKIPKQKRLYIETKTICFQHNL